MTDMDDFYLIGRRVVENNERRIENDETAQLRTKFRAGYTGKGVSRQELEPPMKLVGETVRLSDAPITSSIVPNTYQVFLRLV